MKCETSSIAVGSLITNLEEFNFHLAEYLLNKYIKHNSLEVRFISIVIHSEKDIDQLTDFITTIHRNGIPTLINEMKSYTTNGTSPMNSLLISIILISSVVAIDSIEYLIKEHPNAFKLIITMNDCDGNDSFDKHQIEMFSYQMWEKYRSLYIYFALSCRYHESNSIKEVIYSVNPINHQTLELTVQHQTQNDQDLQLKINSIPSDELHLLFPATVLSHRRVIKLNGIPLRVTFFPSTTSTLRNDISMWKKSTKSKSENDEYLINDYFGLDTDVLAELSQQMNFRPLLKMSTDAIGFGFKVSNHSD